jgi:excisionase family DNA binding protein
LSIEEASIYSNIGTGKLYEMTEKQDCPFVLWIGSRRMIKRKIFEEYIANQYSI